MAAEMFCSTNRMVWPSSASLRQLASRSRANRRQALEWLVEQQEFRLARQRAGDRPHLRLAGGQFGAALPRDSAFLLHCGINSNRTRRINGLIDCAVRWRRAAAAPADDFPR
jgi:hypothetical protein